MAKDLTGNFGKNHIMGLSGSALSARPVTPHDTNELTYVADALRIDVGGTIKFLPYGNANTVPITWTVADGEIIPIRIKKVFATGTTATGITSLFRNSEEVK